MFVEEYLVDLRRARYRPSAWLTYVRRCVRLCRDHALTRGPALRSLGLVALAGFTLLLAAAAALALRVDGTLARNFFLATVLTLLLGVGWMAAYLRLLVSEAGRPLTRINLANLLTLVRLVAIPAFLVCAGAGHLRLALAAYVVGALTDVADGLVARLLRQRTPLGRVFDPIVDILFNVGVFAGLFQRGVVPGWVMALVLTRYGLLLVGGAALYLFRGPVRIQPTVIGKATGVVTTLLVGVVTLGALGALGPGHVRVMPLLLLAIGFVEALLIPQVLVIGWLNVRRIGPPAVAPRLALVKRERASG